jgi:3-carboxy-cis,cis-muconate cycloisomerase
LPGDEEGPGAAGLFGAIVTTDELAAATSDRAWVQAMLDAEVVLAMAAETTGLVPEGTYPAVRDAGDAAHFDPDELGRSARLGGNPVIPLVAQLRDRVGPEFGDWVHFGATSQDILDTAAMIVAERAGELIEQSLGSLCEGCAELCERHRTTLMVGRTLLQHALPTTFGLKAAGWLVEAFNALDSLGAARSRLPVQLGGAVGTLAAFGESGVDVLDLMAEDLGLVVPTMPWHTDRSVMVDLASALGTVAGAGAKIAWDIGLMMQSEVREVFEPASEGRGGSSTLPQKRNPVGTAAVLSAHRQASALVSVFFGAMANEHERAVGGWQAEWQTLTSLLRLAGGVAAQVAETVRGLEVDADAMAANLARSGDVLLSERIVLTLTPVLGRSAASRAVQEAAERSQASGRPFAEELASDPQAGPPLAGRLDELLDPAGYLGSADALIDRALSWYRGA